MKVRSGIARLLKAQGVKHAFCFPTNPLLEGAAEEGIRIVTARTERHAIHMADGYTRMTDGEPPGVAIVQGGPGLEHAFPGVAQAYADSTPLLVMGGGPGHQRIGLPSEFDPIPAFSQITKWCATIRSAATTEQIMARAFTQMRSGRSRPVVITTPGDIALEEIPEPELSGYPIKRMISAGNPADITEAIRILCEARRPVLFVGQGVLWARATDELRVFAEFLNLPVMTTILGKSAFPENHALALGSAGPGTTAAVEHFLGKADVVLALGAGLTRSLASTEVPKGKIIIQVTGDAEDINAEYRVAHAVIGDAKLVLQQMLAEARARFPDRRPETDTAGEIRTIKERWLKSWMPKLASEQVPVNPYRVVWDLIKTVDPARTIITHDAGMPREQLSPFYESHRSRGYIGWGNSHQLGSSLGLIMGAKLAAPDRLAIHVLGDAGLATCAVDLETGIRERIPVLTVLLNNSTMAYYDQWIPLAIQKYRVTDVTGDYLKLAQSLGCYGERVEQPRDIVAALGRCIDRVDAGTSAIMEVVTSAENVISRWGATHLVS